MGISFKVTKLNLREKTPTLSTTKGVLIAIKSLPLRTRQHHGQLLSFSPQHGTMWRPIFSSSGLHQECLQFSARPLSNTAPVLSLQFSALTLLCDSSLLPFPSHWVPLHYTAVMEVFTSAFLFTLLPYSSHSFMWLLPSSPALYLNMLPWSLS